MSGQVPGFAAPFCPRCRDVCPGCRAVEELGEMGHLTALRERLGEGLEHTRPAEPPEALPNAVPFAIFAGQRTPRDAVDREVVQRLKEFPVVTSGLAAA